MSDQCLLATQDTELLLGNDYIEKLELNQSQFMRLWQVGRTKIHTFSQYETPFM